MRKVGVVLTLSALALGAGPAAAAPPGNGLVADESTCGTIVHSSGSQGWIGDQHYAVVSFAFNGEVFKTYGNKADLSGAISCDVQENDGTLTVTAVPVG